MQWKFDSSAPIYSQLVEQIKGAIVTGAFAAGQRLPPVRELAMEAGVNPNTMQRALQELERQGLMFSQRTSGRIVTEDRALIEEARGILAQQHIEKFLNEMDRLGYSTQSIVEMFSSERRDK